MYSSSLHREEGEFVKEDGGIAKKACGLGWEPDIDTINVKGIGVEGELVASQTQ